VGWIGEASLEVEDPISHIIGEVRFHSNAAMSYLHTKREGFSVAICRLAPARGHCSLLMKNRNHSTQLSFFGCCIIVLQHFKGCVVAKEDKAREFLAHGRGWDAVLLSKVRVMRASIAFVWRQIAFAVEKGGQSAEIHVG